jgi:hypothetical protein
MVFLVWVESDMFPSDPRLANTTVRISLSSYAANKYREADFVQETIRMRVRREWDDLVGNKLKQITKEYLASGENLASLANMHFQYSDSIPIRKILMEELGDIHTNFPQSLDM